MIFSILIPYLQKMSKISFWEQKDLMCKPPPPPLTHCPFLPKTWPMNIPVWHVWINGKTILFITNILHQLSYPVNIFLYLIYCSSYIYFRNTNKFAFKEKILDKTFWVFWSNPWTIQLWWWFIVSCYSLFVYHVYHLYVYHYLFYYAYVYHYYFIL